jgi:hypothetical protein
MASPRALGPLNSAKYFSRLIRLRRRSYKCFYPFHVAFAVFGDASSVTRFAAAVLLLMNLRGRVNVFVGHFTRPSQAGRFDALLRPRRSSLKKVLCIPRGAGERIEASELDHPSLLRRATYVALFKVAFFRISLVFRITFEKLFIYTEFAFCALQLEGPRTSATSAACPGFCLGLVSAAKSCYSMIMSYLTFPGACRAAIGLGSPLDRNWAASAFPAGQVMPTAAAYGRIDTFWVILRRYLVSPYICHCVLLSIGSFVTCLMPGLCLVDGYWIYFENCFWLSPWFCGTFANV